MITKKLIQTADIRNPFPWVMLQKWEHVLFIHLPISPEALRERLPENLELDTFDGQAWISMVAFKVSKNRIRYLPSLPYLCPMLQLNVRTYVKKNEEKGVYFFTMDTNKLSVVLGGKIIKAPFLHADMTMDKSADTYHINSLRKGKLSARFHASYTPTEDAFHPKKGSLDYWLLERYIFWAYKNGRLYRGDIQHERWKVQNAKVNIAKESLFVFLTKEPIVESPIVHYACSKVALNGMIKKVK
ncbi:DUF2071 domain-containing protein [Oceanobacillus jeddahense]|uniref:DUF2071 domain-containing protein n=1 Tax=Oceanobacillus jeddahense TaxID=1462527 RepID=A0ABY5JWS4_9BACI|nr:DUF2071 domain-containing protein [Oceanobacillus jeddahense]UUI04234.1 DUF2071 domain-containing protein [Oceanobacillus jeddahense]